MNIKRGILVASIPWVILAGAYWYPDLTVKIVASSFLAFITAFLFWVAADESL